MYVMSVFFFSLDAPYPEYVDISQCSRSSVSELASQPFSNVLNAETEPHHANIRAPLG